MEHTYWHRQTEKALFPELEWNKPERRDHAGRLLIIGGDMHNLAAPATAFAITKRTGIGTIKLALPDKTKRLVGDTLPEALFLPSTLTGEFSHKGGVELLDHAAWADSLLMPGDNGRNSETTILFEDILRAYNERVVLTRDAVDILSNNPTAMFERERTTLVVSFAQLQKLVKHYGEVSSLQYSMDLLQLVEFLHVFSQKIQADIVTLHEKQLIVASHGAISTTKVDFSDKKHWRNELASIAVCYQVWNPHKPLESLTQAVHLLK